MATGRFGCVLFDLGGVLVRLGGGGALHELLGFEDEEAFWDRWLSCPWVRDFERGSCAADEFAARLVGDWKLSVSEEELLARFHAWPEGLFAGAAELVEAVRRRGLLVGCLSNTNALHWGRMGPQWGLDGLFDRCFLSHELGLLKPEREIFEAVAADLELAPARLVLLDDNLLNVQGAARAGYTAVRVRGPEEAAAALAELHVL